MLTRKQLWRKTDSSNNLGLRYGHYIKSLYSFILGTSKIFTSESTFLQEVSTASDDEIPKVTKMRFSSTVCVLLIPPRDELMPQPLELFWTKDDYKRFKSDAVNELRAYLIANGTNVKETICRLYQPCDEERGTWIKDYEECRSRPEKSFTLVLQQNILAYQNQATSNRDEYKGQVHGGDVQD